MMKVFTVHDYQNLPEDRQKKIVEWLDKYQLENVILVTSQEITVQNETVPGLVTEAGKHLAVYADITVKRQLTEKDYIMISNSDVSPNAYTKIAEFSYDDFPWE